MGAVFRGEQFLGGAIFGWRAVFRGGAVVGGGVISSHY
jgi:hypothetical protein